MHLHKFTESIRIARSQQAVFDYTQDYGQRLKWDTFLREAVLLDGAEAAGLGVKSWCVSKHGIGMETEYVSFNAPRVAAIKLTRPAGLFSAFAGSWRFAALEPNLTEATFTYSFALRQPLRLFSGFARYVLQRNVRGRLRDLKQMLEQPV